MTWNTRWLFMRGDTMRWYREKPSRFELLGLLIAGYRHMRYRAPDTLPNDIHVPR